VPAPGVELGLFRSAQADVAVATNQAQQEPNLLLPAIIATQVAADPLLGNLVAQPLARARDDLHMLGLEADLFVQLAKHGLFRRLTMLDAALRKLPGVLLDPFAPEDLVTSIEQDDADIRAVTVLVQHSNT